MKDTTKQALLKALFEATFVVFGVVLALLANNWWTHRSDLARADAALASIVAELEGNRDALVASSEYHGQVIQTIQASQAPGAEPVTAANFEGGFIQPAKLLDTAWTAAAETDALRHLDFEVVKLCSSAYADAHYYKEQLVLASGPLYRDLYEIGAREIPVQKPHSIFALAASFYYQEQQLIASFSQTIDELRALD